MREPHGEDAARRPGPESCAADREGGSEALTGVRAGPVLSREITHLRGADAVEPGGRQHRRGRTERAPAGPRAVVDPAHVRNSIVWELRDPGSTRGPEGRRDGRRRR